MFGAADRTSSSNGNPMESTSSSSTHWSSSSNLTHSHEFVRNAHNDQRGPELRDSNIRSRSPSPRRVAANNQTRREYANRVRLQALERQIDIIQDHLRAVNHALEAIAMLLNAERVANVPQEVLMLMDDEDPHWAVSWVSAFEYDQAQNLAEPGSPTVLEESTSENEALTDITNQL